MRQTEKDENWVLRNANSRRGGCERRRHKSKGRGVKD